MLHDRREFEVELVVTSRYLVSTYSRTPEEAEQDAEALFEEGSAGNPLDYEIEMIDAIPVGEEIEPEEDESDDE